MMMGGSGTRLGADRPKQYIEVSGKPVFAYIVEGYDRLDFIDEIVVVSHESWTDYVKEWTREVKKPLTVTCGGETRSHSVRNGLRAIAGRAKESDVVLFHDATHPYVDSAGTREVIEAIRQYGGATLATFQYDTVYRMDGEGFVGGVIPRQEVIAGASPEGFRFGEIYGIYDGPDDEELRSMTSAGAIARAHDIKMKAVKSDVINLKITYPADLETFKQIRSSYFFKE